MTSEQLDLIKRITHDPEQCGGKPCIRSMRIRVGDVLEFLANGLSFQEVLNEYPDLEMKDIRACLLYAFMQIDHPILSAA